MYLRRHWLGLLSVGLGIASLGFAVVAANLEQKAARREADSRETRVTIRIAGQPVSFATKAKPAAGSPTREVTVVDHQSWGRYASLALGLAGLFAAPIAWTRYRDRALGSFGAVLPLVAISWQYIAAGITVGVAVVIVLVVLGALGGSGSS